MTQEVRDSGLKCLGFLKIKNVQKSQFSFSYFRYKWKKKIEFFFYIYLLEKS